LNGRKLERAFSNWKVSDLLSSYCLQILLLEAKRVIEVRISLPKTPLPQKRSLGISSAFSFEDPHSVVS
jgi:hypothetical protein